MKRTRVPAGKKQLGARVAVDVLRVLAERGASGATRYGIADDIEELTGFRRSTEAIRLAVNFLYAEAHLLEKVGYAKRPPQQKSGYGPIIWKLHHRLRYAA